jgi:hypothetical protein
MGSRWDCQWQVMFVDVGVGCVQAQGAHGPAIEEDTCMIWAACGLRMNQHGPVCIQYQQVRVPTSIESWTEYTVQGPGENSVYNIYLKASLQRACFLLSQNVGPFH